MFRNLFEACHTLACISVQRHGVVAEGLTLTEAVALCDTVSCEVMGKPFDLALLQPCAWDLGAAHPCFAAWHSWAH